MNQPSSQQTQTETETDAPQNLAGGNSEPGTAPAPDTPTSETEKTDGSGPNLGLVMKIPVTVQVILGTAKMPVSKIMELGRNAVIPLDRHVGDPIDVVVNGRTVARGEVVLMEDDNSQFGISLTEIVRPDR